MPAVSRSGSGSAPGISDPRSTSGEADSFTGTSLRTRPSARSLHRRSAGRGVCAIFAKWGKTSSGSDVPRRSQPSRSHFACPVRKPCEGALRPNHSFNADLRCAIRQSARAVRLPHPEAARGDLVWHSLRREESPDSQPNTARNTRNPQPLQTPRQPTVDRQLLQIGLGRISEAVV